MKKTILKEVSICDICGASDNIYYACHNCGIQFCYDCNKTHGKSYNHGLHFSGSGDGYYCNKCDAVLTASKDNILFNAYKEIEAYRAEEISWYNNFKARYTATEDLIKRLTV